MTGFDEFANQRAYRDEVERSYNFAPVNHDMIVRAKAGAILDLAARKLGDPRGLRFLDVGCGPGIIQQAMAPHVGESHGVDLSAEQIEEAKRASPQSRLQTYDGKRLPFDDGHFDVAYTMCVMHHVPPAQWPAFTAELLRVVRPGGIAAVLEHNPYNPLTRLAVYRCAFDDDAVLLSRRKTRALLTQAGGKLVEQRYILFLPFDHPRARGIEARLGRVPMGAQYYVAVTR